MKQVRAKDSLAQLWARLGIDQAPLVRAPKRAFDNERGPCTMMNLNLAVWLEEVQGFDVSQFDYEALSQMTVKQYICQNSGGSSCTPGYPYVVAIGSPALIEGMNLSNYGGVYLPANTPCVTASPGVSSGLTWPSVALPSVTSWGKFLGAWITHLNTLQSPFPTTIGGANIGNEIFLDLNNTGYLDLNDAMQWTTCIGYYGCS